MNYDHYAIVFDQEGKPKLHVAKWDPKMNDYLVINEYIEDIADILASQFLDPNSPKYINK